MAFGKDELFATLEGSEKSKTRYFKTFAVIAVVVIGLICAGMYFYLPDPGDEVRPPAGLEDAVRDHMASTEKREMLELKAFYCKSYYAAQVKLEKPLSVKQPPAGRITDTYDVAATQKEDGTWTVSAVPDFSVDAGARPCWSSK